MDLSPRYLKVYRLSEPANRKQILEAAKAENPSRWSQNVRNSEPVGPVTLNPEKPVLPVEQLNAA
jgi:putative transposase